LLVIRLSAILLSWSTGPDGSLVLGWTRRVKIPLQSIYAT